MTETKNNVVYLFPDSTVDAPSRQVIDSIVLNLMYTLNIPDGTQLVTVLDKCEARNNKEALHNWVLQHYPRIVHTDISNGFELLKDNLNTILYEFYFS